MEIYKFGGASIANPERMIALLDIITQAKPPLVIVVSAYGKTTNALEKVVDLACKGNKELAIEQLEVIENNHNQFAEQVTSGENLKQLKAKLEEHYTELNWAIDDAGLKPDEYTYDQIVCVGEILSSTIFGFFLKENNIQHKWLDVRDIIRTDNNFRNANVDEEFTQKKVDEIVIPELEKNGIILTQGFVGATSDNASTTLGREGSDYSAALFAAMLHAERVTIWKDVEGFLNADPKQFSPTHKIEKITFREVIEMAYYGAQIIHSKTIKPLQNANIPLFVKCFLDASLEGTIINNNEENINYPPLIVLKENQVLLQITSRDFSFITEDNISLIYQIFHHQKVKINLIQNAAISLVVCVDYDENKLLPLIEQLEINYQVLRNENMNLLTIRHYNEHIAKDIIKGKQIILEQKTRTTYQIVY